MMNMYQWVSRETIQKARESDRKPCPMCAPYGTPRYVVNAVQVVNCWQCNPTTNPTKGSP